MKLKLVFFTSSRADYGKIKEVIKNCKKFDYKIIITGSHLLEEYGHTIDHIKKDFPTKRLIKFPNQNLMIAQNIFSKKQQLDLIKL